MQLFGFSCALDQLFTNYTKKNIIFGQNNLKVVSSLSYFKILISFMFLDFKSWEVFWQVGI